MQSTRAVRMGTLPRVPSHPCLLGLSSATVAGQPRSNDVHMGLQGPCILTAHSYDSGGLYRPEKLSAAPGQALLPGLEELPPL
eukprot:2747369-Pyramimonas_sp.AAC.1